MRQRLLPIALSAGLLIFSTAARAQSAWGHGAMLCSKFNSEVEPGTGYLSSVYNKSVTIWAQGFMSGLNVGVVVMHKQQVDMQTLNVAELWSAMVVGCQRRPDVPISSAVTDFFLSKASNGK